MERWQRSLVKSITKAKDLANHFDVDEAEAGEVISEYIMRITPHFLKLIKDKDDPIGRQVIPSIEEMNDHGNVLDPLKEEEDSPVPNLVHRYPDRVLFMVTNQCPIYCRFCTRKRILGEPGFISKETIQRGVDYIASHSEVRDVILSGGDPLLLPDHLLESILKPLRAIPHLDIIRIGTRVPGALPSRITKKLCSMLKKYHPFYINAHFNHPDELTPEVMKACGRLADAGIPLGSQTVLLKGINDDPEIMKRLMQKLLKCRVKPYYLYQADLVRGTEHFRTSVDKGLEIIRALQGFTSGMAVPHFVIDAPGGGGKIPLLPETVIAYGEKEVIVKNYENKIYRYPQPDLGATAPVIDEPVHVRTGCEE